MFKTYRTAARRMVFEYRVMTVFGPKRPEVRGDWGM